MPWLIDTIRERFRKRRREPENVEHLRIEFRERYHSFKLLLGANQRALDIMADVGRQLGLIA